MNVGIRQEPTFGRMLKRHRRMAVVTRAKSGEPGISLSRLAGVDDVQGSSAFVCRIDHDVQHLAFISGLAIEHCHISGHRFDGDLH